ncbi:MAG: hypothetical protein FJ161_02810 [Gammaproteobacteria bacterium]|nr:hypothetical protein [Gammaproteobacteria bacterium]
MKSEQMGKRYSLRKLLGLASFCNVMLLSAVCLGVITRVLGHSTFISQILVTIGLYGLSGSVTNTLALWMIFEKVPGIWKSGMIEQNFPHFQSNLKETLIEHLFSKPVTKEHINWDYQVLAKKLHPRLAASSIGMLVQLMSMEQFTQLLKDLQLENIVLEGMDRAYWDHYLAKQIATLSPADVKDLIWKILDENLQWLVIWGAFFGMLFGVLSLLIVCP